MLPWAALGPWSTTALSLLLAAALPAVLMPLLGWWHSRGCRLGGGSHVLITGGSKGLGLALARLCVARGCSVTIVARNQKDLDEALAQLKQDAAAAAAAAPAGNRRGGGSSSSTPQLSPVLQALSADTVDPSKVPPAPVAAFTLCV